MTTGRRPDCSEPDRGDKSAQKTSPRFNVGPRSWRSNARSRQPPIPYPNRVEYRRALPQMRRLLGAVPPSSDGATTARWLAGPGQSPGGLSAQLLPEDRDRPRLEAADGNYACLIVARSYGKYSGRYSGINFPPTPAH